MQKFITNSSNATASSEWELVYALPNLTLRTDWPIEGDGIAIVAHDDPRLSPIKELNSHAAALLTGFRDARLTPVDTAALIIRTDAPRKVRQHVAPLVDFRNAAALSVISLAWAEARPIGNSGALYADYFDFYPTHIDLAGRLLTDTPALRSPWWVAENPAFHGMPSPAIGRSIMPAQPDHYLLRALTVQWSRRYVSPAVDEGYTRTLFRSLAMAYQAAALPTSNLAQRHDYGVATGLWVSACEILSHPAPSMPRSPRPRFHQPPPPKGAGKPHASKRHKHPDVNWTDVTKLLGEVVWGDQRIDREYGTRKHHLSATTHSLNLVQYIYMRLYDARNDFLHGNPIGRRILRVWPHGHANRPPITALAPVVYRTALHAYLARRVPVVTGDLLTDIFQARGHDRYRDCLLQLVGPVRDEEYR